MITRKLLLRALAVMVLSCACTATTDTPPSTDDAKLVFLTRDGCLTSRSMRESLDVALQALNRTHAYRVVNQSQLPATDPRVGYPTPTLLYNNRDVFGMPEPTPPLPKPT